MPGTWPVKCLTCDSVKAGILLPGIPLKETYYFFGPNQYNERRFIPVPGNVTPDLITTAGLGYISLIYQVGP
jgi:hypothetical protein